MLVARDRAVVDAVLVAPGEGVREGLGLHVLVRQRAVCVEVGVLWACCERVVTLCESTQAIMMNTLRSSKAVVRVVGAHVFGGTRDSGANGGVEWRAGHHASYSTEWGS